MSAADLIGPMLSANCSDTEEQGANYVRAGSLLVRA